MIIIKNTSSLEYLYISEALDEPHDFAFNEEGERRLFLKSFYAGRIIFTYERERT